MSGIDGQGLRAHHAGSRTMGGVMTAPRIHTDPGTGQRYLWNEATQAWEPILDPPPSEGMPGRYVSKTRKRTSHGLHLFLTIITGGLWGLFVWLPITLWHKMGPRSRTVTHQA
jgi:hypothetical protein